MVNLRRFRSASTIFSARPFTVTVLLPVEKICELFKRLTEPLYSPAKMPAETISEQITAVRYFIASLPIGYFLSL